VGRWLDEGPPRVAVAAAVAVFLGLGLFLLGLPLFGFISGLCGALALIVWLASSGEPVVKLEPAGTDFETSEESVPQPPEQRAALREPLVMVELASGTFLMGSPETEAGRDEHEGPRHRVRVSAFAMAAVPVTQRLYAEVIGTNPSQFQGAERPVEEVSWFDAVRFCNALSLRVGLVPCYRIDGDKVEWNRQADGYRLPTEAEWEYACRAGTETAFSFGDAASELGEYAWFWENSDGQTHEVGEKRPNAWGLYDLHGNVLEWCWDWYTAYKATSDTGALDNPAGPATGNKRVLRGGSFNYGPWYLRAAHRNSSWPEIVAGFRVFGFRCVRGSRRQP